METRPPALALALAIICLGSLLGGNAVAGEVAGRVVLPVPLAQASLGALSPLSDGADDSGAGAPARGPVLIYVAESEGALPRTRSAPVRVRIAGGRATPSLVAVSLGSTVRFENADRKEHRLVSRRGPLQFDLGWQAPGMARDLAAEQTGNIRVECSLHKDVRLEIVVLAHAAFALTDGAGSYTLPDLPAGRATIVAYAPRLGEVSREVEVPQTGRIEVDLAF